MFKVKTETFLEFDDGKRISLTDNVKKPLEFLISSDRSQVKIREELTDEILKSGRSIYGEFIEQTDTAEQAVGKISNLQIRVKAKEQV